MHLRHDDVRVVARVTDDGRPFGVSQQVAAARCCEQFGRIVSMEQKRMPDWAIAVESLEIQPRRPRVPQSRDICVRLRRRSIGGDVVGDELSEKGPAGRLRCERRRFVCLVSTVAQAAGATENKQQFLLGAERGEIRKEAPVHRRTDRRIDRPLCARRRETLDVVHVQILVSAALPGPDGCNVGRSPSAPLLTRQGHRLLQLGIALILYSQWIDCCTPS